MLKIQLYFTGIMHFNILKKKDYILNNFMVNSFVKFQLI